MMHRSHWWRRLVAVAVLAVATGWLTAAPAQAAGQRPAAGPKQEGCPPLDVAAVPLGPEGVVPFGQPTFSWRPVPGIHEYVVLVLLESDNEQTVWLGHAEGTSITSPPLPAFTRMRWKVKTECDERYGPFSPSMYFTIEPSGGPCPPTQPPVVFGPQPGTVGDPQPTFSWRAVPGASSYTLYVLMGNSDAWVVREQDIHATAFTPNHPLPVGVPLRWKVKAESSCGAGPYSPLVYFDVGKVPCGWAGPATPFGPQGTLIRNRPLFRWGAGSGAAFYTLFLQRLDTGQLVRTYLVYDTVFTAPEDLPVGPVLRWFVQGSSGCGDGDYSAAPEFRIR